MNKIKKVLFISLLLFITGCGKDKAIICNIDVNNKENNYMLKGTYKIYYKDKYVTKIDKKESYTSDDENIISYFKEYKNLEYKNLSDIYGGYEYEIKSNKESVNISATIDLKNVDIKEMVKNGELDKDYTINNKLTSTGAKYLYTSKGAVCNG